jgi:hypothetical protein
MPVLEQKVHRPFAGRSIAIVLVILVLSGAIYIATHHPSHGGFYQGMGCTFRQVTGWLCPGCGGTRGVHYLLRGEILLALRHNLLLLLLTPCALICGFFLLRWLWTGKTWNPKPLNIILCGSALIFLGVVFAVLRNLPGMEFLRPP